MRHVLAPLALVLGLPCWGAGQTQVQLYPGDRVRVTAPACQLQKEAATLIAIENDLLSFTAGDREIQCRVEALTRLEVSLGDRDWHEDSVRGMKAGALLGLVMGGVMVARADLDNSSPAARALAVTVGMGAAGFLIGTGIGAVRDPEDWLLVPLPPDRYTISLSGKGRVGVGVSLLAGRW